MSNETNKVEIIKYETKGVCCKAMYLHICDNKIQDVEFMGGCAGNLLGIRNLIIGKDIDSIIQQLQGITCGSKTTSCPDQLAKCLIDYKNKTLKPVEVR